MESLYKATGNISVNTECYPVAFLFCLEGGKVWNNKLENKEKEKAAQERYWKKKAQEGSEKVCKQ